MAIFAELIGYLAPLGEGEDEVKSRVILRTLGMQAGILIAFLLFQNVLLARLSPIGDSAEQADRSPWPIAIRIAFKWLLISYPLMVLAHLLSKGALDLAGFEPRLQEPVRLLQEGGDSTQLPLMILMIVAGAPIAEELFFRGVLFRYFHNRMPLYVSLGITAVTFASIHNNLYSFAPLAILGVTLALSYRESNSILSPIVLHASFNTINLVLITQTDLA